MTREKHNYLRMHRRRHGLTQDEVAYLLGTKSGTRVSRYERRARRPNLDTAFGCQVIFDVQGYEIFEGCFSRVKASVAQRARRLLRRLEKADLPEKDISLKRDFLKGLIARHKK